MYPCCCVLAAELVPLVCASICILTTFVAVETGQLPLLPRPGSKGAGLPYVANDIVVATLFMVPRWRLYQYVRRLCEFLCCCVLAAAGSLLCAPALCTV